MKRYLTTYLAVSLIAVMQWPSVWAQGFKQEPISDHCLEAMKTGDTFDEAHSPVPRERLRLLTVKHIDFKGKTKKGQMVVLDTCAEAVLSIFKALYKQKFPIHKIQPLHHYQGDDKKSMADNNTSSHNCRPIKNTKRFSLHAYGAAIDINPIQNPCVYIDREKGIATYAPTTGIEYANRRLGRLGKEYRQGMAEAVVAIFAQYGFYWWGGDWNAPQDYQHFQLSKNMTELYIAMEPAVAQVAFDEAARYYNRHKRPLELVLTRKLQQILKKKCSLIEYYQENPQKFNKAFKQLVQS